MALVTTAVAQYHRGLSGVSSSVLTQVLEAASDAAELYCDRVFTATAYTEVLNGNGLVTLWVKNPPINSITSVAVRDASGTSHTLSSSDYDYEAAVGSLTFGPDNTSVFGEWPNDYKQNVTIVYNGGYSTIPEAVQEAVCIIAVQLLGELNVSANPAFKSETIGARSYTRFDALPTVGIPPAAAMLLAPYRKMEV